MQEALEIVVTFKDNTSAGAKKASRGVNAVHNSVADLERRLKAAILVQKKYTTNMSQWGRANKVVLNLQDKLQQELHQTAQAQAVANRAMSQSTRGSANMTMALQSMNFTIRDSPYFFRDFCLGKGTLVRMADNSLKKVEDVVKGDLVLGDDYTPRKVLDTSNGKGTLYKIDQQFGDSYVVNPNHILSLIKKETHEKVDIGVEEYLNSGKNLYGYKILPELIGMVIAARYELSEISITKIDNGEYYGFYLDGNHRFMLGDYTVTHNSLGILAVGNNLNPMIDSIIAVKREFGGWRGAMKAFAAQMMGPAGVIMAFSLAVTAIQAITFAMAKNKDEVKEVEEAYDSLIDTMKDMSRAKLLAIKVEASSKVSSLLSEGELLKQKAITNVLEHKSKTAKEIGERDINAAKELAEEIKKNKTVESFLTEEKQKQLAAQQEILSYANLLLKGHVSIRKINAEINDLKERYVDADKEEALILDQQIKDLEELKKAFKVADESRSQSLKNQKTTIEDLIKTDEELIKSIEDVRNAMSGENVSIREKNLLLGIQLDLLSELNSVEKGRLATISDVGGKQSLFGKGGAVSSKTEVPTKLEGVEAIPNVNNELDKTEKKMAGINSLANTLGTTIWNAFSQGKFAADEFLKSLISIAAQMLIIEGLKSIFSGGAYTMFSFLHEGGVVKASGGYVGGYGGADTVPAMLTPGEAVFNKQQQYELYRMSKGITYGENKQKVLVEVSGVVEESKNKFYTRIKKAEKHYTVNRGM